MPQNVEIKARVNDLSKITETAKALSKEDGRVLHQNDTFYNCNNGRLKLRSASREDGECRSELIFYRRPDHHGPKVSDFARSPVLDPDGMNQILTAALGSQGTVEKKRTLFLVEQTRIHIDHVVNLGNFMELEVVLREDQSPEEGASIAHELMKNLGVKECDLVTGAYHDLLQQKE